MPTLVGLTIQGIQKVCLESYFFSYLTVNKDMFGRQEKMAKGKHQLHVAQMVAFNMQVSFQLARITFFHITK